MKKKTPCSSLFPSLFALLCVFLVFGCLRQEGNITLAKAPLLGNKAASVEIIIFSDFQCPFCKRAAKELSEAYQANENEIKLIFKHYPLSYHPQAKNAARAAEAARVQDKFWEMHDLLFAHTAELDDTIYLKLAEKIGLNTQKFLDDFSSSVTENLIRQNQKEAETVGITGTPYILINRYVYLGPIWGLKEHIDTIVEPQR